MNKIIIDDYAIISQGVHMCAGSHDYNSKNHQIITAPIYIGVRAWLCAEVFIGLGVSIAEGVVVGARSVVIKDINEKWSIYAGIPVKKVGVRNNVTNLI